MSLIESPYSEKLQSIEEERYIRILGYFHTVIKPDYEILENNQSKIIIKVKRLYKDEKFIHNKKSGKIFNNIDKYLDQRIRQLRSYCIFEKKTQMIDLLTMKKHFVFTLYNIKNEFENQTIVFEWKISIFEIQKKENSIYIMKKNLQLIMEANENLDK